MNRSRGLLLALLTSAVLVPADAFAQEPKDDKYTREASKQLGVAMLRQDEAERRQAYQEALTALQEGMVEEADNPKIWFLAGQAYAGLMDFAGADSAFEKAVSMYPEYEAEVEAEREVGWMNGFNAAVAAMDQQNFEEALRLFEGAHEVYPNRPEHLLNMGSIYANQGNNERAIWAFEQAIAAVNGPRFADLDPEGQAQWKGFEEMAQLNISQMRGQAGVEAFEMDDYDQAIQLFEEAAEANPYSRDFLFNIVQARYAKAQMLEEQRDTAAAPGEAPQDADLVQIYTRLQDDVAKVQEYDPNNENLMLILTRAKRRQGELSGSAEQGQQGALQTLEALQAMPVTVTQLLVQPGEGTATIQGSVKNNALEAGASAQLEITLLASDGSEIAKQQTSVTVPAKDEEASFEVTVPEVARQVAGWKYRIVS